MTGNIISNTEFQPLRNSVSDAEWQARVDLAAAFRLGHHLQWNDAIRNHITCRIAIPAQAREECTQQPEVFVELAGRVDAPRSLKEADERH